MVCRQLIQRCLQTEGKRKGSVRGCFAPSLAKLPFHKKERQYSVFLKGNLLDPGLATAHILWKSKVLVLSFLSTSNEVTYSLPDNGIIHFIGYS